MGTSSTHDDSDDLTSVGGRLRWARRRRGLSQAELAKAARVSQSTIGNIEAGLRKKPRELVTIAKALGAAPVWLDTGKGDWETTLQSKGLLFAGLTTEERELLQDFRVLMEEDQQHFAQQIAERAAKMRSYATKILERVGLPYEAAQEAQRELGEDHRRPADQSTGKDPQRDKPRKMSPHTDGSA